MRITAKNKSEIKLGLTAFISLCLIFSPLLFHFVWGNHDWLPIHYGHEISYGLIEGRFSQFILQYLLFSGNILPIINLLFGFIFYALALVTLCTRFFNFSLQKNSYLIIAAIATLPYINEILYFQFISFSQLTWPFIITLSLLCAKKATTSSLSIIYTFLSFILLFTALGGYPASINLYTTATALWLIAQKDISLSRLLKLSVPYIISLLAACLCLYAVHTWLKQNDYMMEMYNNRYGSFYDYFKKIIPTILISAKSFLQPQPFLSLYLKITLCFLVLLWAIKILISKPAVWQKILTFILLIGLLLCLKFSAFLSNQSIDDYFSTNDPIAFMMRADFYAIPCLILFCLSWLSTQKRLFSKNIVTLISIILIIINTKADINFCKTHILGFHAEALLQERIINRLEQSPKYNPYNYYSFVQAGEISLRSKYYTPAKFEKYGLYTLKAPYSRHWLLHENYNFYAPKEFVFSNRSIDSKDITQQMYTFLSQDMSIWPSVNATYVDDKYYIISLTSDGQKMISQQFRQIPPKER